MKKTLLLLVALITATIAFAKTEIDGIYYNLNDETKTAEVTSSSNKYSGNITIPEKVTYNATEYSVTSIGTWAFLGCSSLTSITIPNSVTSIGNRAFYKCTSLKSITIGNSVTSIGFDAFAECPSLTSITIPNSVTSIGESAFRYCSSLKSITIGNSVTSIGNDAFAMCSSLTSITIPNSVTSIGGSAFYSCYALTSITIPNSVTSIGNDAFAQCSSLISITIEATTPPTLSGSLGYNGIIHIPDNTLSAYREAWGTGYIFENNEATFSIHVETPGTLYDKILDVGLRPEFVTKITVTGTLNDDDFTCMRETMTSLIDISLSNIINTTGVYFNGKHNLVKINLPQNIISITESAFSDCSSLTSITIPNRVTSIGGMAFRGCSSLTSISIPNSVTSIEYEAFRDCSSLTSITIPNSVTSIGGKAFQGCSSLTSITIPNNVTSIEEGTFLSCTSLASISIPNSVTSISNYAFSDCPSLISITIPNGVTSIGNYAFSDCPSLISITIPNSITSIGEGAFYKSTSLTSITIPNSVTSIGSYAFHNCSSLTSITCLGSTPPEASLLMANTTTCTLIVPKVAYNSYLRHDYWGQFLNIETIDVDYKKLTVIANNTEWGVVEGGGYYNNGDKATLTATANESYRFMKWSDDVTDNPRTVVVTQDSTFTAIFKANTFAITTAVNDDAMGSVTEGGEYAYGSEITLTATANSGYRFVQWSDGNTENPRTLILTEDIELYAYFKVADATNVETSKISSANIYTINGTLYVENATENYHILDAAGRLIYSGNATTLQLPRGIYLITMGSEVENIVL